MNLLASLAPVLEGLIVGCPRESIVGVFPRRVVLRARDLLVPDVLGEEAHRAHTVLLLEPVPAIRFWKSGGRDRLRLRLTLF